jgi:hypothetical protein
MRSLLLLFAILGSTLVSGPAAAQGYKWCVQGINLGYPGDCSYSTYAQCMATASGTNDGCGINPYYAYARGGYSHRQHRY